MDLVIGLGEEEKSRFLQVVMEFAKAFALCATEIGFFKAVKAGIVKLVRQKVRRKNLHKLTRSETN